MTDLARLQPLLEQAQAAIAELEAGRSVADPRFVPTALAVLIRELKVASSELESQVALLGVLLFESEALMGRLEVFRLQRAGGCHEQRN